MITELTPEQEAAMPKYVEKWTAIGLDTNPADRQKAEEGIRKAYAQQGRNMPIVKWYASPYEMVLNAALAYKAYHANKNKIENKDGTKNVEFMKEVVEKALSEKIDYTNVPSSLKSEARSLMSNICYGQHDANWLAFYDFFRTELGLVEETKSLDGFWEIGESAGWFLPFDEYCYISDRHEIVSVDEAGRLHAEDGPALKYRSSENIPGGFKLYVWHGVKIPEHVIERPETITVDEIDKETNAEVRRVMITKYGDGRYLKDSGATKVSEDDWGTLYRKELRDDEPIALVEVKNSTPEPDGSIKTYFLRVDPQYRILQSNNRFGPRYEPTPLNAIASTFGLTGEEYARVRGCES